MSFNDGVLVFPDTGKIVALEDPNTAEGVLVLTTYNGRPAYLVLNEGDPVPDGTPSGTIILRRI